MLPFICQIRQGALAAFAADGADAVCGRRAEPILHPGVTGRLGAGASLSAPPFTARQASLRKAAAVVLNDQELCSPRFSAGLCRVWTVSWPPQAWGAAGWASRCRQCPPPPPPPHGYLQSTCNGSPACPAPGPQQTHINEADSVEEEEEECLRAGSGLALESRYLLFHWQPPKVWALPVSRRGPVHPATRHASSSSRREMSSTQTRDVQGSRVFPVE